MAVANEIALRGLPKTVWRPKPDLLGQSASDLETEVKMLLRRSKLGLCAALGLALAGLTVEAGAAPVVCGERAAFTQALKGKFKEERQALGLVATSSMVELYVSPGGSWTVLMTGVDGKSCVLATGHSWETATPKAAQSSL